MADPPVRLFGRIRANLLVRVLVVYAGASWFVLEIVDTFGEQFGLPTWYFPAAVGLLLIGLPIILATAMVQTGLSPRAESASPPESEGRGESDAEAQPGPALPTPVAAHRFSRWLTWRRSILGGVLAFTALGILGTVMVLRSSARVTEAYGAAGDAFEERAWIVVADFEGPADEPDLAAAVREALTLDLQQSRYVNVYAGSQVSGVLRLMELPDTASVDGELARQIAQREGLAAVLVGSISRLGDDYVLGGRVVHPATGEELVVVSSTSAQNRLVEAVQALSREIRLRLGESREAIRASQPLPRVTTRSLEALRRYAQAVEALARGDEEQALDLAQAAIDLDPEFAMAYRLAGVAHSNLLRTSEYQRYTARAYELRDKLSERERLHIEALYVGDIRADPVEAIATYELILAAYPDDGRAANNLAVYAYYYVGDYERAYRSARRAVELNPYTVTGYGNAIRSARRLDRWAVAESLAHLAMRRGLTEPATRWLWGQAIAEGDWARAETVCDSLLATTSSRGEYRARDESACGALDITRGRIARAVERLRRAAEIHSERGQYFLYYLRTNDLVQAELLRGRRASGQAWFDQTLAGIPLDSIPKPDWFDATYQAAYAAAQLGDLATAERLAAAYAADTSTWSEAAGALRLHAELALAAGAYDQALDYDRRAIRRAFSKTERFDQFLRAQAFDGLQQWDSAVALYEDVAAPHSIAGGGGPRFYLRYLPVVHRRLGELYAQAGDPVKAAEHYEAFIELWSDCDPELRPQLEAAQRALERLGAEQAAAALIAPSSPSTGTASPSTARPSSASAW